MEGHFKNTLQVLPTGPWLAKHQGRKEEMEGHFKNTLQVLPTGPWWAKHLFKGQVTKLLQGCHKVVCGNVVTT